MIADDENFVSRWSRRKIEARETTEKPAEPKPTSEPAPAAPAVSNAGSMAAPPAPSELPPLESLKGLASEYTEFLKPGVDENLRRSALKKLFADPHFENFERFEAYCEDFTKGEPIPLAMLKTLEHAKGLLFDDEEKKDVQAAAEKPVAEPPSEPDKEPEAQGEAQAEAPPALPAEPKDKA